MTTKKKVKHSCPTSKRRKGITLNNVLTMDSARDGVHLHPDVETILRNTFNL